MSYLWKGMCLIAKTPGTLLVFNQFFYWAAIFLFAYAIATRTWCRLLIIAVIGLWPPLYIISLHLWADVGMMCALAFAVACLAANCRDKKKYWLFMTIGALFLAAAFRHNGITGVVPLLAYTAWRLTGHVAHRQSSAVKLFGALIVAYFLGLRILNIGTQHVPVVNMTLVWDLTAISVTENRDVLPVYLEKTPGPDFVGRLRDHWSPDANYVGFSEVSPFFAPDKEKIFLKYWGTTVLHNFGPYMAHRVHVFRSLLGLTHRVNFAYHEGIDEPNPYKITFTFPNLMQHIMLPLFHKISKWPVYRVWLYVVLSFFLIYQYFRDRYISCDSDCWRLLPAVTVISGILIELPLFIVAPSTEFRYSIWMIFSVVMAAAMIISQHHKASDSVE
ncbi:hypothetical protein FMA36_07335 [Komagataeibacter xylinus]|uniref:Glycosyltransferase RgtA/B/C/D-like domain-containing protein n=2 Tax=Komagataeibacter xylinus TaxID=28448 RepID=A0A857FM33_KOMXY|nr:hypothetical protein FMA36_07335 [Komagataeibacter xylinus]